MFVKLSFISQVKSTVRVSLNSSDKCKLVYVSAVVRASVEAPLRITDQDVYLDRLPFESREPFKSSRAGMYHWRKCISEIVTSPTPG